MAKTESATKLAAMASGPTVSYTPLGVSETTGGRKWHLMKATTPGMKGAEWDYWLAYDFDSYRGRYVAGDFGPA